MAVEHRVKQLSLEVHSVDREEAFRLRGRLRQSWHILLPALESEFDAIAGEERWVRLGQLRLDLGVTDADALEGELPARIREAIKRVLDRQCTSEKFSGIPREADAKHSGGAPRGARRVSRDVVDPVEALERYLLTGHLPWYLPRGAEGTEGVRAIAHDAWRRLAGICARQPDVHPWLRWLDLVDGADFSLSELLDVAAKGEHRNLQRNRLVALLGILSDPRGPVTARHRRHGLTAATLAMLGSGSQPGRAGRLPAIPVEFMLSETEWRVVAHALGEDTPLRSLMDELRSPLRHDDPGGSRRRTKPDQIVRSAPAPPAGEPISELSDAEADLSVSPAVRVAYAGSVLLHPWLPRLFDACGIPVEDGSIPLRDHERAAALLCFAVLGDDRDAEYNLEFIKVLLGLPRDRPLSVRGDLLGDDERAEVDAMLASLIGHWSALKGTTIAGLRSAFLQRAGTLKPVEDGYALAIERTGIDVLLDQIPFSYSVVKLPWMPRPIHVEW